MYDYIFKLNSSVFPNEQDRCKFTGPGNPKLSYYSNKFYSKTFLKEDYCCERSQLFSSTFSAKFYFL